MNDNTQITLRGRIGTDPDLRVSQKGTKWTRFRIAVPVSYRDREGNYVDLEPRWYTVCAWGKLAANVASTLNKGDAVMVIGHPTAQGWLDKEGAVNSALTITAHAVGPDLTFSSVRLLRPEKQSSTNAENNAQSYGGGTEVPSVTASSFDTQPGPSLAHDYTPERTLVGASVGGQAQTDDPF